MFMLAYTYIGKGKFALAEKPKPTLIEPTDTIVRVTMNSICSSDLYIKILKQIFNIIFCPSVLLSKCRQNVELRSDISIAV